MPNTGQAAPASPRRTAAGAVVPSEATIEVVARLDAVAVSIRRTPVLRGLHLQLAPGEVLGVLGANGSGKSTLLQVLATLVAPSAGAGRVLGHQLGTPGVALVRPRIALVGHLPALYGSLTLAENLRFVARLTGRDDPAVERVLAVVGLDGAAGRRAQNCSQGMQRRAELARVLLVDPALLLLDEVHAGLDPGAVRLVDEVVARVRTRGGAAVLVSHEPDGLSGVADRLVRIVDGGAEPVRDAP